MLDDSTGIIMSSILNDFKEAQVHGSGQLLASTLVPSDSFQDPNRLRTFATLTNHQNVASDIRYFLVEDQTAGIKLGTAEASAWADIFVTYWKTIKKVLALIDGSPNVKWTEAFDLYNGLAGLLIRGYTSSAGFQAWTVPCLHTVGKYLRVFAMKADAETRAKNPLGFGGGIQDDIMANSGENQKLEEAARTINKMWTTCLTDRSPIEDSRRWGVYSLTGLLFKTYFKLNTVGLCKNILRALEASAADLPPISSFPTAHIVTYKYYRGVIAFLDEHYSEAEQHLTEAWTLCHAKAHHNRELILTYLIPAHLLTTHTLPTDSLLSPYPRLEALFRPLCNCIKRGDLSGFDAAMSAGEPEFVKRRIYLTLERGRDIALRNLCRKVFIVGGFEEVPNAAEGATEGKDVKQVRRTRVPVKEFAAAMMLGDDGKIVDLDEVECFLAGLIYKNLMKGYIARERGFVVLSKGDNAFPGTGV